MGTPAINIAQTSDDYSNWRYLYENTFENDAGQEITQQWWLNPDTQRQNTMVEFTLLARRSPISLNGTAAAVFDYVADCSSMAYALEEVTFLDSTDAVLTTQNYDQVMEPADPESEFYGVLQSLCGGL